VARVTPHNQGPLVVFVHTEIEAEPDADFSFRLWEYNTVLTLRFHPVVTTVALLPFMTGKGIELAHYVETAFGQDYISSPTRSRHNTRHVLHRKEIVPWPQSSKPGLKDSLRKALSRAFCVVSEKR
jgi:hypothetical protein